MNAQLATYLFGQEVLYKNSLPSVAENKVEAVENKPIKVEEIIAKTETVQEKNPTIIEEKIQAKSIPVFTFQHAIVVLVDTISEEEKALLSKILVAIGTSIEQVDLIKLSEVQTIDYQSFIAQDKTRRFISFGVGLGKINWNIILKPYQPKRVENIDFLLADELRIIDSDLPLKKVLWGVLKVMFS